MSRTDEMLKASSVVPTTDEGKGFGAGTLAIERWRVKREVQTASRSREHAAEVMEAIDGYVKVAHSIHCSRVALVMLAEIDDPLLRSRLARLFDECA